MTNEIGAKQFGDDYYNSLSSLTFNSRPIIESHTALAQENLNLAPEIVSAIEKRINKAIPSQKLYALYLLDSIAKNVGIPYTSLFGSNLFKIFSHVYSLVDDQTRIKLIKLFKTWKTPIALTGLPLFNQDQLEQIENFLIKATANNRQPGQQSNNSIIDPNIKASRQTLINEIDYLINLVNLRLIHVKNDNKGKQRFELLQQLRIILTEPQSSIPQQQLFAVQKQLQSIREDEVLKINSLKQQKLQQQQQPPNFTTSQLQNLLNLSGSNINSNNNNGFLNNANNGVNNEVNNGAFNNSGVNVNTANAHALFNMMNSVMKKQQPLNNNNNVNVNSNVNTSTVSNNISNQTNNNGHINPLGLKNIGFLENILRKTQSPTPDQSQISNPLHNNTINNNDNNNNNNNNNNNDNNINNNNIINKKNNIDSTNTINSIDFKFAIQQSPEEILSKFELNQTFLNNHKPTTEEIDLIYFAKENQCSNCPKRFKNNIEGTREKELHLDWHFRINKKLKNNSSQIQNRAWYLNDIKWIHFKEDEITGSDDSYAVGIELNNKVNIKPVLTENELNKHFVSIPPESGNEIICGICRDKLVGIFDDDSGEWIWKNATKQRGKIYHYSCWVETKGKKDRDRSPERS